MSRQPQPGRDGLGRWISNDATTQQATDATLDLIEMIARKQFWHADEQRRVDALLALARSANDLSDAGTRPATEEP